jgi:hypothetical protein
VLKKPYLRTTKKCLNYFLNLANMCMHTQTNQDMAVRLLTRKELSDRWHLSIETLKRRERCGLLPFLKLGRGVRYRLADIERLEAEAEVRQSGALAA